MLLLAGLGNPDPKHADDRHNVGFMAVERIANAHGFGSWRQKFNGNVAEGILGGRKTIILKPTTWMNNSGRSVASCVQFFRLVGEDIVVFYDEIDLLPGKVRVRTGGGHNGHNGIRDIHRHIGTEYGRVRIGVGRPNNKEQVTGHVLGRFTRDEQATFNDVLEAIADAAPFLASNEYDRFQSRVAYLAPAAPCSPAEP